MLVVILKDQLFALIWCRLTGCKNNKIHISADNNQKQWQKAIKHKIINT